MCLFALYILSTLVCNGAPKAESSPSLSYFTTNAQEDVSSVVVKEST